MRWWRENFRAVLLAIGVHIVIALPLLVALDFGRSPAQEMMATAIPAEAISAEEFDRPKREVEIRRKAEEEARRKAEEEARRQAEEETKRKAAAEAEARRQAEEEAKRKAAAEAKRKAEEEARRRREAEAKAEREADMHAAMQAEAERLAAIRAGKQDQWIAMMQQTARRYFSPPLNAGSDFFCAVEVRLIPGGDVASVQARKCDSEQLARVAENAIWKAAPFPMPQDPSVFERNVTFEFVPPDTE